MEIKQLKFYINQIGRKIKTDGLTLNQNSSNNELHLITMGDYDVVEVYFKQPNGQISPKYHMIRNGAYQKTADDLTIPEIANNDFCDWSFPIPFGVTSFTMTGSTARLEVSFAGYAYNEADRLIVSATANTQVTVNASNSSDTLDGSYSGTDVENLWKIVGELEQTSLPTVVNDRYLHTNANTGALEWSTVQGGSEYTAGTGININNKVISADQSVMATKTYVDNHHDTTKQDTLTAGTNITISGNVISASGSTYTAGNGIAISAGVISANNTIARVSDLPTKTSDITNDSGFITKDANDLTNYTRTSELGDLATLNTVNYNTQVTNKPTIPTKTSDLTNDSNFINKDANNLTNYTTTSDLNTALAGKENADATILKQADVKNNVTSTDTNKPLSAYQGKLLNDRIDNMASIGRFLSIWNATTGAPVTEPTSATYTYRVGDYYRVGTAGNRNPAPNLNYFVGGTNYVVGADLAVGDTIYCSNVTSTGTTWAIQGGGSGSGVQDATLNGASIVSGGVAVVPYTLSSYNNDAGFLTEHQSLSGYATETYVQNHHDSTKQDVISDLTTIRSGATAGATAVQPETLNNYSTTSQMNTAISNYHDNSKQNTLTAGSNITIDGSTISATDTTYTANMGIVQTGNNFALRQDFYDYLVAQSYTPPTTSLTIKNAEGTNVAGTYEYGTQITVAKFAHIETNTGNITGNLYLEQAGSTIKSAIAPASTSTIVELDEAITLDGTTNTRFSLKGMNSKGNTFSSNNDVNFVTYNYGYVGTSLPTAYTASFKKVTAGGQETYGYNTGDYLYILSATNNNGVIETYALMQWGSVPTTKLSDITFTQSNGVQRTYHVYRTTDAFIGAGSAIYRLN